MCDHDLHHIPNYTRENQQELVNWVMVNPNHPRDPHLPQQPHHHQTGCDCSSFSSKFPVNDPKAHSSQNLIKICS
ncbi:unnamed protein product, partial [Vitis vinifera]